MNILLLILYTVVFIFSSLYELQMLQQNSYNDLNRFQKFLVGDTRKNYRTILLKFFLCMYLIIINELNTLNLIIVSVLGIVLLLDSIERFYKHNDKLKLKFTKRLIRILSLDYIFYIVILYFAFRVDIKIGIALLLVYNLINTTILTFIIDILKPVEKLIFNKYKKQALEKLSRMNNINIIGITGSFGKTSTKLILNTLLETTYKGFITPASFNTPNGLTITINNEPTIFNDYFIAEMGAKSKGEIKELCDIVHPKYGILSSIGAAHLDTFKSMENICNTKFELIESLPSDGLAILNKDDEYQTTYELKNKVKVKWIGINHKADYMAKNIKVSSKGTTFDVVTKDETFKVTTILLGNKNVYNILASIALAKEMGVSTKNIIKGVENIAPINHRLEIKQNKNITIIDDAFNSNPEGARNAVEVLSSFDGPKYIITPGMVEMGDKEEILNKTFGMQIAKVCDKVFLVGPKHTKPIYEGLIENGFNKDNIVVCKSFKEAYAKLESSNGNKKVTVLFENDLPDSYTEG